MTTPKMSRISGVSKTMECIGAARVESRAVIAHRPRGPRTWLSGAADLVAPKSAFTGGSRAARMGGTGRRCTLATAAVDIRTPHSRLPNPGHQRTLVSSCGDPCSCVPACGISRDIPRASSPGCTAAHPVSSSIPAMLRRVAASTRRAAALPVPRSSRTPCHARRRMRSGRSAGLRPRAESRPATRLLLACLPACRGNAMRIRRSRLPQVGAGRVGQHWSKSARLADRREGIPANAWTAEPGSRLLQA